MKRIFTLIVVAVLAAGCQEKAAIIDANQVNSFSAQDIPDAQGIWWEYECGTPVSLYQDGMELHREVYSAQAGNLSMEETFTVHDSIIVTSDTSLYQLTDDAFCVNVGGQWKELLRFPVVENQSWTTFDGDQLTVESTREQVTLPIGTFSNCIKVVSGNEYKAFYYAYGLGLILIEDLTRPDTYYYRLSASSILL